MPAPCVRILEGGECCCRAEVEDPRRSSVGCATVSIKVGACFGGVTSYLLKGESVAHWANRGTRGLRRVRPLASQVQEATRLISRTVV